MARNVVTYPPKPRPKGYVVYRLVEAYDTDDEEKTRLVTLRAYVYARNVRSVRSAIAMLLCQGGYLLANYPRAWARVQAAAAKCGVKTPVAGVRGEYGTFVVGR